MMTVIKNLFTKPDPIPELINIAKHKESFSEFYKRLNKNILFNIEDYKGFNVRKEKAYLSYHPGELYQAGPWVSSHDERYVFNYFVPCVKTCPIKYAVYSANTNKLHVFNVGSVVDFSLTTMKYTLFRIFTILYFIDDNDVHSEDYLYLRVDTKCKVGVSILTMEKLIEKMHGKSR